jgi:hypothetical protein
MLAVELVVIVGMLALLFVFAEILSITGVATPPHKVLETHFTGKAFLLFSFSSLCAYVLFFFTSPTAFERSATALAGVLLTILFFLVHRHHESLGSLLVVSVTEGFGTGAMTFFGTKLLRSRGRDITAVTAFCFGLSLPVFTLLTAFFLEVTIYLQPNTYDNLLYSFDGTLGFQLSFLLGKVLSKSQHLFLFFQFIYLIMPLLVTYIFGYQLRATNPTATPILRVCMVASIAGYIFYNLYPAVGPRFRFETLFPATYPAAAMVSLSPSLLPFAPRNAMPSLHFAWALLIWWNSRPFESSARLPALVFLVLTFLSTLGLGEHYLIDLVVAVPFAIATQASCDPTLPLSSAQRTRPIVIGFASTMVWLLLLRYCIPFFRLSPIISWIAVAATVWVALRLKRGLKQHISS